MRFRSIAIRAVLITAALASVATSAPEDYELSDPLTLELTGPVTIRAYARANARAFELADQITLRLEFYAQEPEQAVLLVPDDPSQPIVEGMLTNGYWYHQFEWFNGEPCPRSTGTGCELGVSIEVPEGGAVTVEVLGQAIRYGDLSFFFPEDRRFPEDAAIEVGTDE